MRTASIALTIAAFICGGSSAGFAHEHKHSKSKSHDHGKKRHHKSHEHGYALLDMLIDGQRVDVDVKVPAESIFGFEHKPRTEAQKAKVASETKKFRGSANRLILFEDRLSCLGRVKSLEAFAATKERHHEGSGSRAHKHGSKAKHYAKPKAEHSEVHASLTYTCKQPVAGSKVNFAFSKIFPGIKKVRVQAIGTNTQAGATIKSDRGVLQL